MNTSKFAQALTKNCTTALRLCQYDMILLHKQKCQAPHCYTVDHMFVYTIFTDVTQSAYVHQYQTTGAFIETNQVHKSYCLIFVGILNWTDSNTKQPVTADRVQSHVSSGMSRNVRWPFQNEINC